VIVVLVHKPEEVVTPQLSPFDGIAVYGIYYESEEQAVHAMVEKLMNENPDWAFVTSNLHKMQIGFDVPKATKPAPRRRK
jgi:hypothetical protein